jgi:competence ComEA-like helix-hairpin-helix protein
MIHAHFVTVDFLLTLGECMNTYFNTDGLKGLVRAISVAITLAALPLAAGAAPINVNTATQTELETIKGIGPAKAKTIIAERLDGGHFQDANDLQKRVRGIGMRSVEKMVDNGLTIEAPSSFREPNGRSKKEGVTTGRRHSRNQSGASRQPERSTPTRRN